MKNIRLLLAEDHTLVLKGITDILEKSGHIIVVNEVDNGYSMIEKYFEYKPDIVLSDIEMPKLKGIEAAKEILHRDNNAKILFLTGYNTLEYIYWANKIGVLGLISKTVSPSELLIAIKTVAEGNKYFMNKTNEELEEIYSKYELKMAEQPVLRHYCLSIKEKEVLKHISDGLISEQIADKMGLSKKSIDAYRIKIMKKLNLLNFAQLMRFAVEYTNDVNGG